MLPARIPRSVPQRSAVKAEQRKERTAQDHVDMVKQIGMCAATGRIGPVDPHHLMRVEGQQRGTGMKTPGRYVIPLCREVHIRITPTGDPEAMLMLWYSLDARALQRDLWAARGDLERMKRSVVRHFWEARRGME